MGRRLRQIQRIPQYLIEHRGMSLEDFQGIFWWEWTHRFLGRLLGVLFVVPFLWFAWKGAIRKSDWPRFVVLGFLGLLQGFIGWWMVESGLETRVSVSQYRLAIHLGAAILLLGAVLWIALEYLRGLQDPRQKPCRAFAMISLIYVQMLLGALVAGLHAGLLYNTWLTWMGGFFRKELFPPPWWLNPFENPGLAQFDHRIGAYILAAWRLYYAKGINSAAWPSAAPSWWPRSPRFRSAWASPLCCCRRLKAWRPSIRSSPRPCSASRSGMLMNCVTRPCPPARKPALVMGSASRIRKIASNSNKRHKTCRPSSGWRAADQRAGAENRLSKAFPAIYKNQTPSTRNAAPKQFTSLHISLPAWLFMSMPAPDPR